MVSEASKTSPERAKWDLPAPMKALGSPSASYAKPKRRTPSEWHTNFASSFVGGGRFFFRAAGRGGAGRQRRGSSRGGQRC